jgi:hypothetical protein
MKTRPILFNGAMVRALLAGTKTQTRRVAKGLALEWLSEGFEPAFVADDANGLCPYGHPGDRLWVRETWRPVNEVHADYAADYNASDLGSLGPWKPSIHMPRWASRITLEIVSVRVERLQDISEGDAIAEGVGGDVTVTPCFSVDRYRELWESINGPGSWEANPWVWVVEFKRESMKRGAPTLDPDEFSGSGVSHG